MCFFSSINQETCFGKGHRLKKTAESSEIKISTCENEMILILLKLPRRQVLSHLCQGLEGNIIWQCQALQATAGATRHIRDEIHRCAVAATFSLTLTKHTKQFALSAMQASFETEAKYLLLLLCSSKNREGQELSTFILSSYFLHNRKSWWKCSFFLTFHLHSRCSLCNNTEKDNKFLIISSSGIFAYTD